MATCSHMVRPATTARVRARALGARDVGVGEEGQSLTLYQVMMRVFYVYICTYLALETTPYLYVNGFCTGCDPAKKAVADRFSPANHPLTAKVCPNVHVCVHVCVLCVYMCILVNAISAIVFRGLCARVIIAHLSQWY